MSCGLAARGLWVHFWRVMIEADPYGFFVGRNGETIVIDAFARRIAAQPREVRRAIAELENNGVFSRDSDGRIYCRRFVRERSISQQNTRNAESRWQPRCTPNPHSESQCEIPCESDSEQQYKEDAERNAFRNAKSMRSRAPDPMLNSQNSASSLRSSAAAEPDFSMAVSPFGDEFPGDVEQLRELAAVFLGAFGNVRDPLKAEKHLPAYTAVLAQMRSRGVSIMTAWTAFGEAKRVNNGRPLFAAMARSAMSFLPSSRTIASRVSADDQRAAESIRRRTGGGQ